MHDRVRLLDLSHAELAELMAAWDQPRFRADQIWTWLYQAYAASPEAMANLPPALRARLSLETTLDPIQAIACQVSADGRTRKVLFELHDGLTIESVLMSYDQRQTACISVQAGCAMGCTFCATGQGGLERNLTPGEIVGQVLYFARLLREGQPAAARIPGTGPSDAARALTNVVFMGMGEPLANYEATRQSIERLTDPEGFGLGARRITVSTVGLVPGIRRLARERLAVNLAVSLHAPDDELRSQLVPLNRRFPLAELMAAIRDYTSATHRRVSFEYALILGLNDSAEQAQRLAALLKGILCHVNLIPLNPTPGSPFRPSTRENVDLFCRQLRAGGIPATVRVRRGIEIQAGCGQLRERHAPHLPIEADRAGAAPGAD